MEAMYTNTVNTAYGDKTIDVYCCNIADFDEEIDVLITSAFRRSYKPTPRTMFEALLKMGISVEELAVKPEIDMRELCDLWLSKEIRGSKTKIGRIGCIEMSTDARERADWRLFESNILKSIKAYFGMLDVASVAGIKVESVAMPLLGGGVQGISSDLTLIPIINESVEFLRRNEFVKKIYFIDLNPKNAFNAASTMQKMYSLQSRKDEAVRDKVPVINKGAKLFISYNSDDRKVADDLCAKLEAGGIKVWYAPRDIVDNDYASSIVRAISECSHFVTIISKNSLKSEHVLNEIDLAFGELKRNIRFLPLRIDLEELRPAFTYYLSRQHWTDAHVPPLDSRLDEFVEKILGEMN